MKRTVLHMLFGVVLMFTLVVIAPTARADQWNQATQVTFKQPVQIPGNMVLGAGTYWFRVPEGIVAPHVVQIFNAGRTQIIATVEALPTTRPEATSLSEFTFAAQSKDHPVALISWFYPGRLTGQRLLYSSQEEAKLAKNEQITVTAQPSPLVEVG